MVVKELNINNKTAILLLSHGSKLPQGKEVIEAYTQMFKDNYPEAIVDYAFMEIRKPDIPETVSNLTSKYDLEKLIVVPVFVAHGLHTKRDIPAILGIESDFIEDEVDIHNHDHSHGHHDHGHEHHHHHHHHDVEKVDFDGEIVFTEPLGIDSRIFDIIVDRVEKSI